MVVTIFRDVTGLGREIRLARKGRGWSQADLARLAGTDPRQISRIETAAHEPKLSLLLAVIAALDLDLGLVHRQGRSERAARPRPEDIF
ncbi:MAG: helix-turn-helix transcriptional regulator [Marinovum algicola]|jgi:HTH-type transcriptional regulator/antitoxin HipB|uniref:HTH-type transcriptional regulator / antitoxin HipB n=1 Tax=Marinovum algicola TaxID=42444 RepID=A0A975ZPQ8_9RHOB|nr:helix-turn-helix transcriptional regulator [Marinovum algicola]SEJ93324.1 HTH-type transcriptional regulator / antitoxin HipB [Marinovum algicola]SLN64228.1 helix-turn-helix protein [Marinovum algicola]